MAEMVLVRDIMTKNPRVIRRDTNVQEVVATMNKFDISSVIVVREEHPVGIITHKDIMSKIVQPREIMTTPVVTVNEDASIEEAVRLMAKKNIKKLPVITDQKLVGIITSMDLVREEPKLIALMESLLKSK